MAAPAGRWEESLGSINSYVHDLKVEGARITVAVFDSSHETQFQIIRHSSPAAEWIDITAKEVQPRGGTPLLDAIRDMVRGMDFVNDPRSVLIVVTDGGENSSKLTTKAQAKAMIDCIKAKDWQVLFIGADFDAFSDAQAVGVGYLNTINTTMGNYRGTMSMAAMKGQAYASSGAAMAWNDEDRKKATGDKS
jgi:hypothetical protein